MKINRIFCIGRNYADHIDELGEVSDGDCVVFIKPASCVVPESASIRLPRNSGAVHHEAELVVMLTGGGRDLSPDEAPECIAGITLGLDLTLRDLQNTLKSKAAPWELCKAFDDAAPLGDWKPYLEQDLQAIEFTCHVNGQLRQHGQTRQMIYTVNQQISILSRTWSLQPGDIIYTGTPKGIGPLLPGDEIVLASPQIGRFAWTCS